MRKRAKEFNRCKALMLVRLAIDDMSRVWLPVHRLVGCTSTRYTVVLVALVYYQVIDLYITYVRVYTLISCDLPHSHDLLSPYRL
jgi:hypothetical protein